MIDPMVGGEPLDMMKIYTVAIGEILKTQDGMESLIAAMEEAADAMGNHLEAGEAVFLPDAALPDRRFTPLEKILEGVSVYQTEIEHEE